MNFGATTPGLGVSKFLRLNGRPARSPVVARSPRRLGRAKLAYTFILFLAVKEREPLLGTTFRLPGLGAEELILLTRANAPRFD